MLKVGDRVKDRLGKQGTLISIESEPYTGEGTGGVFLTVEWEDENENKEGSSKVYSFQHPAFSEIQKVETNQEVTNSVTECNNEEPYGRGYYVLLESIPYDHEALALVEAYSRIDSLDTEEENFIIQELSRVVGEPISRDVIVLFLRLNSIHGEFLCDDDDDGGKGGGGLSPPFLCGDDSEDIEVIAEEVRREIKQALRFIIGTSTRLVEPL